MIFIRGTLYVDPQPPQQCKLRLAVPPIPSHPHLKYCKYSNITKTFDGLASSNAMMSEERWWCYVKIRRRRDCPIWLLGRWIWLPSKDLASEGLFRKHRTHTSKGLPS